MKRGLLTLLLLAAFAVAPAQGVTYNPKGYVLQFSSATNAAPVDATTYFIGSLFGFAPTTTAALQPLWIPKAGTIRAVYLTVVNLGTAGTTETSTVSLRLNNSTDTTITAAFVTNAVGTFSNTALGVAVTAGSFVEIKWLTPTWATNPTNLIMNGVVYVDVPN